MATQALDLGIHVVGHEAEVRAAGVVEPARARRAARLLVLEQLEAEVVAAQVDDAQPQVLDARHLLDPAALGDALGQHLEAEVVAVERDRAVGIGDRQADVEQTADRHQGWIGLPPSVFVTVKAPSTGRIAPLT